MSSVSLGGPSKLYMYAWIERLDRKKKRAYAGFAGSGVTDADEFRNVVPWQ